MALPPTNGLEDRNYTGLSLCSGFGGLELGLHTALPGYKTVCYVEQEAYAAATLVARMEDQILDYAPIWSDLKTFDGKPWDRKVHILSAGYPCQPFSASGLRRGRNDPRHLWPDVARIIQECHPEWVFCENVEGHLDRGFEDVARDLQGMGFAVKAGLFSAAEVGASHLRRRLFILAHANDVSEWKQDRAPSISSARSASCPGDRSSGQASRHSRSGEGLVLPLDAIASSGIETHRENRVPIFSPAPCDFASWEQILERRMDLQPQLFGLDDGVAHRMERARAAGNGVVSLAAAYAFVTLHSAFQV